MTRRLMLAAGVLATFAFTAADARAADPPRYTIDPHDTDAAITDTASPTPGTRGKHLVWLAPEKAGQVNKLLLFLPSGGNNNTPDDFVSVGAEGGRLGYHTIVLAYKNEIPIANPPPCGRAGAPPVSPPNCAKNARLELFDGGGESPVIAVSEAQSIKNRLIKLLQYLDATQPGDHWGQFLAGGLPNWPEIVIAGQSLGAGEAFLIGMLFPVDRVATFSGWVDGHHNWVAPGMTAAGRHFTLIHGRDQYFGRTCYAYLALALVPNCPLLDFPVPPVQYDPNPTLVDNRPPPPFDTRQLVINLEPATTPTVLVDPFHPATSRENSLQRKADGTPVDLLLNSWRFILGDQDADTYLDQVDNCPGNGNPNQADADGDGVGDACDATPRGTVAPVITVAPVTVDATGPAGALVLYSATATDDLDGARPVICTPAAGLFAIGGTSVTCTATDLGNNTATAGFVVTVRGAASQLADLWTAVDGIGPGQSLINKVSNVQATGANNDVAGSCSMLSAFGHEVGAQSGKKIPADTAASLIADASRIQAVLSC